MYWAVKWDMASPSDCKSRRHTAYTARGSKKWNRIQVIVICYSAGNLRLMAGEKGKFHERRDFGGVLGRQGGLAAERGAPPHRQQPGADRRLRAAAGLGCVARRAHADAVRRTADAGGGGRAHRDGGAPAPAAVV